MIKIIQNGKIVQQHCLRVTDIQNIVRKLKLTVNNKAEKRIKVLQDSFIQEKYLHHIACVFRSSNKQNILICYNDSNYFIKLN